jgi:hypothetical protein
VTLLSPDGPVDAVLGPGSGAVQVLTFDTIIATPPTGGARLVDIPTDTFLALPVGTLAYTGNSSATQPSVHALWVRMHTPTGVSSDSITILKPLGGASRDVWVRLPTFNFYWQQKLVDGVLTIDGVTGNDENFGDVANPLLTADEAARRLGYYPGNPTDWTAPVPLSLQTALDRIAAKITPVP